MQETGLVNDSNNRPLNCPGAEGSAHSSQEATAGLEQDKEKCGKRQIPRGTVVLCNMPVASLT